MQDEAFTYFKCSLLFGIMTGSSGFSLMETFGTLVNTCLVTICWSGMTIGILVGNFVGGTDCLVGNWVM